VWHEDEVEALMAKARALDGAASRSAGSPAIPVPTQRLVPAPEDLELQDYRLIAENASDVVFRADVNGIVTWISPSVERLLGWPREAVTDRDFLEYVHDDDQDRISTTRARVATGVPVVMEFRARHRSGDYIWISSAVRPLYDEQGTIIGRVGSWRDATERQLAQQRLEEAKEQFRLLAENASDIVYMSGPDRLVRWIAPTVESALGWKPSEIIGTTFHDLLHPDDARTIAETRERIFHDPDFVDSGHTVELRLRKKSGEYRWFSGNATQLTDGQGRPVGIVAGMRDVHDLVIQRERAERGERRLAAVLETLFDPHLTLDAVSDSTGQITDFVFAQANAAACEYLKAPEAELIGMRLLEVFPGHANSDLFNLYVRVIETGEPLILDEFAFTESGGSVHANPSEVLYLDLRASRVGNSLNFTFRDVTERHLAQRRLTESEKKYRRLAENAADVVYEWNLDGRLAWVSPSVTQSLGWTPEAILGRHVTDFVHPEDLVRETLLASADTREARLRTADGEWKWMRISGRVIRDGRDRATGFIETAHDIQAEMSARMSLAYQAGHDPLTGLPNRRTLLGELDVCVSTQAEHAGSLLAVGIDDLGSIIDGFTHAAADSVVSHVAAHLQRLDTTRVARITEDEFAVLLPLHDTDSIADLAEAILSIVKSPTPVSGHSIDVTVSIGIAARTDASTGEEWLRNASTALHHAKSLGGNRWEFQDAGMAKAATERVIIRSAIRDGLAAGQFRAWFQPVVSLLTRSVVGYEALARWITSDARVVPPDVFIPAAAHANLILDLDRAILGQALERASRQPATWVSVNVSSASLCDPGFVEGVRGELARTGARPSQLQLEVTETSLLTDTQRIQENMNALAEIGVSWWVDDFGTGFSSITHLRDLPVEGLKLDRSFTQGITADPTRSRLAQGLQGLARGMSLSTVAEGIETEQQAAVLGEQGWQMGQGWLFGRPSPDVEA
jgi:diguanylate cyclase (GGDEF)-like protein/PAS domain S-box-containing protein